MKPFFLLLLLGSCVYGGLLPDYDTRCDSMRCHVAPIDPTTYPEQEGYFLKQAPNLIHQIWFGDKGRLDKKKTGQWRQYAEQFGFEYTLWSEADDETLKSFMNPKNFRLMVLLRENGTYWAASDVLRYELMKKFGGLYIDCDFAPPTKNQKFVDIRLLVNFQGLTLLTEHDGRNVGATAIFVGSSFIIAPPDHPFINSVVDQIYDNAMHWYKKRKNYDGMFITGPFLLNKVISGCFNVVPCRYLHGFNMYD